MEHKMSKQVVSVVEEESRPQRRTSVRSSSRKKSRGSNSSESSESRKEESPHQLEWSSTDLAASCSTYTYNKAVGSVVDAPKEARVLNNFHARRQIIRPWEDSATTACACSNKQIPSIDHLHPNCRKKLLPNGGSVSTLSATSDGFTSPSMQQANTCTGSYDSGISTASNSVQTAAEALVEIGQLTPSSKSQESMVEDTEVVTTKSTSSVSSTFDVGSSCTLPGGTDSASLDVPSGWEEVVIDRKRQLALFDRVTQATGSASVEQMDRLHSTLEHIVFRHRMTMDKHQLIEVN